MAKLKIKTAGVIVELGGNAIVPNDAPILPAQAFVDAMGSYLTQAYASALSLTNKGISSFSTSILDTIYNSYGNSPDLNLSGNALDVASVNAILAWYAQDVGHKAIGGDGIINISGGTNAAPSYNIHIQFPASAAPDTRFGANAGNYLVAFDSGFNLADSEFDQTGSGTGQVFHIGVADNPTRQQIIDACVANLATVSDNHDGSITFAATPADDLWDLTDQTGTTGITASQSGGIVDKKTLTDNGWTVTTN